MNRRKYSRYVLYSIITVIVLVLTVFAIVFIPNRLHDEVTLEAGSVDVLTEELFLKNPHSGTFKHDYSILDLSMPSQHTIKIKVGYFTYKSTLKIEDTIAPRMVLKPIISPIGQDIEPSDFILSLEDETIVSLVFLTDINPHESGVQEVTIQATDLGNNTTIQKTTVLISQVKEVVYMEAGTEVPDLDDFLIETRTSEEFITDLSTLNLAVGTYRVEIMIDDRVLLSKLEVVDTTPPTATANTIQVYMGDPVNAKSFVRNIVDVSSVTVSFKEDKKWTAQAGTFKPIILLTDASNNQAEIEATLVVIKDTTPPVLSGSGLQNRTVYVNASFNYTANVFANDNRDGRIPVKASGTVNFAVAGEYPVTFSAEDRSGNVAKKSIVVTVKVKPAFVAKASTGNSELDSMIDALFKDLLHGDMNQYQVAASIYNFGRSIRYQAGPLASEWTSRAISSLNTRTGNCFGRMYVAKAMLIRAGIPNREQIQYNSDHSWNQVNIGNGWQNFDIGYANAFLVSDQTLKNRALTSPYIKDDNWDTEPPASE